MNREDIIRMAQECQLIGMRPHLDGIYQEALERFAALVAAAEREECAKVCDEVGNRDTDSHAWDAAAALRAALAEEAMQKFTDVSQEIEAALAEPVQEPASKMTAGRAVYFMERFKREEKLLGPNEQAALDFVISMLERQEQAEPVQKPVAKVELMMTGGNAGLATRIVEIDDHLRERRRPGQLLYAAPPQRRPLTEDVATELVRSVVSNSPRPIGMVEYGMLVARAVERAHGIGD